MAAQFTTLTSRVIPFPHNDVDTDQIIPARFLKVTDKAGLGQVLFADWRYAETVNTPQAAATATPRPDFVLNQPQYQGAQILLAGDNFGCGSSREHAPWALTGWGITAIISTRFADIFGNNALKNGLLPIVVSPERHQMLFELVEETPQAEWHIDLASQRVHLPTGESFGFEIDSFYKTCLLNGVDQLGYILSHEAEIAAYEAAQVA
mgnify:CR=1 FL=1